jgi:hypothetical protein
MMTPQRILGTFESLPVLTACDMKLLERQGIPSETLLRHPIKLAYVQVFGSQFLFDQHCPSSRPVRTFAMLSLGLLGDLVDILVWAPETGAFASWLGVAWGWGEETMLRPRLGEQAVPIYRTPLGCLRRGLDGIVPLRPKTLAYHLMGVPALIAEDWAHRAELLRLLHASLPRILVRAENFQ